MTGATQAVEPPGWNGSLMLSDHRFATPLTVPGNAANHAARPSPVTASARFRGTVNAPTGVILPLRNGPPRGPRPKLISRVTETPSPRAIRLRLLGAEPRRRSGPSPFKAGRRVRAEEEVVRLASGPARGPGRALTRRP